VKYDCSVKEMRRVGSISGLQSGKRKPGGAGARPLCIDGECINRGFPFDSGLGRSSPTFVFLFFLVATETQERFKVCSFGQGWSSFDGDV